MIETVRATRFCLRLSTPLRVGRQLLTERRGLIVALTDDAGRTGYGEVAPLPGVHRETLETVHVALRDRVAAHLAIDAIDPEMPSLAFGLEMAWTQLLAQQRGVSAGAIVRGHPRPRTPINALIEAGTSEVGRALRDGSLTPYPTVKVKVGRRPLAEERTALATLVAGLPASTTLRLDANRAHSLTEACALVHRLPAERIEFVEEPLREPSELAQWHARTGLRAALDETLRSAGDTDLVTSPAVTAWVLKPSALGLRATLQWAERAGRSDIDPVVSSCFESGLGLWFLAHIAAAIGTRPVAAGLATDRWLAEDLIAPRFSSTDGVVELRDAVTRPSDAFVAAATFRELA